MVERCLENEMRKARNTILVSIVLLHATAFSTQAGIFTTSDLEGTWDFHMLVSGDAPQWIGWAYGTQVINDSGDLTFTSITRSSGNPELPADATMAISASGVVTIAGTDFHGIMNSQKYMIVGVMTDGGGGFNLIIFSKQGTSTFSTSDLEGTWDYSGLISGDAPAQTVGWYWGAFTFNEYGVLTSATPVTDSLGNSDWVPSGVNLDVTSTGMVTDTGGLIRGVMNPDKDMIVAVGTMCPGRDTDVCGYNLLVMQRPAQEASIGELYGAWQMHGLVSGDGQVYKGWFYVTMLVSIDGSSHFVAGSYLNSSGETGQTWSGTLTVTSDGILAISDKPEAHGILGIGKDMTVITMNDGGGGYNLVVSVRGARTISGYTFASNSATFENQYFPASVGYKWIYRGYGAYDGYTKISDALSTEIVYGVSCLKGKIQDPVEGIRYFWGAEDTENNIHIFKFQYESHLALEVDSDDDIPANIQLIGSPDVEDSWIRSINGDGVAEYEVMSLTATADGYDNCLKVKGAYGQGPDIDYEYFKAGVGLVKTEWVDDGGSWVLMMIPGDFCGEGSEQPDGYVDYWDLLYFAQRWHSSPSDTNWDPRCDLDKEDNYVDYWDLLVFAQQWHKGQPP